MGIFWNAFRPFAVSLGLRLQQFSSPEGCLDQRTAKSLSLLTFPMKLQSFWNLISIFLKTFAEFCDLEAIGGSRTAFWRPSEAEARGWHFGQWGWASTWPGRRGRRNARGLSKSSSISNLMKSDPGSTRSAPLPSRGRRIPVASRKPPRRWIDRREKRREKRHKSREKRDDRREKTGQKRENCKREARKKRATKRAEWLWKVGKTI